MIKDRRKRLAIQYLKLYGITLKEKELNEYLSLVQAKPDEDYIRTGWSVYASVARHIIQLQNNHP